MSWMLQNYLPRQSPTRDEFLQNVTTQYYYKDYTKFAQQRVDLKDIREYCKQSFRVIDRNGSPQFWLRFKKNGRDDWRECVKGMPFTDLYNRPVFFHEVDSGEKDDDGKPIMGWDPSDLYKFLCFNW